MAGKIIFISWIAKTDNEFHGSIIAYLNAFCGLGGKNTKKSDCADNSCNGNDDGKNSLDNLAAIATLGACLEHGAFIKAARSKFVDAKNDGNTDNDTSNNDNCVWGHTLYYSVLLVEKQ